MPAKKNQTHTGRPFEIVPPVSIITYVDERRGRRPTGSS